MLVNLSKIFQGGETEKQLDLELDFKGEDVNPDALITEPVKVSMVIKRGRGQTSITLGIHAKAVCSCARCLQAFNREFDFSQEFVITPDTLTQPEPEIPVSSDYTLDVKRLVLQELVLEIPTVLLCREDCQGLCNICGKAKEENCNCQSSQVDPRLLILKQLLDDNDN